MAAVSPAVSNDIALWLVVLLTLLLAVSLTAVIQSYLPDAVTEQTLEPLIKNLKTKLREGARAKAGERRRKEAGKKDIRAECQERGIWKPPRPLEAVTFFRAVTISTAGFIFVIPYYRHSPPLSHATTLASAASAITSTVAFAFDGSEFAWLTFEHQRKSKHRIKGPTEEGSQPPSTEGTRPMRRVAEKELERCCTRLVQDVDKLAHRIARDRHIKSGDNKIAAKYAEIEPQDVMDAWEILGPREPVASPARSRTELIVLVTVKPVALLAVTAVLYRVFTLATTRLPAGRQLLALMVVIAALFALYLVLAGFWYALAAVWKRLAGSFHERRHKRRGSVERTSRPKRKTAAPAGSPTRARDRDWQKYWRPTIPPSVSPTPPRDLAEVLDALRFGWYMAEVRGRSHLVPPPGAQEAMPPGDHPLPLQVRRPADDLRAEAQAVLIALASRLGADLNSADGSSYSRAVDRQAKELASARASAAPNTESLWKSLAALIYQFDAHVQTTMNARSEMQVTAYLLGRGLAETYWALDPAAPCDPVTADCWAFLLGEQRCDELTALAGRLSGYFTPYCLPAIAGTVRMWQTVASVPERREGARNHLHRQTRRWYELLILTQNPSTFIKPYALASSQRMFLRTLRALWIQFVTAAISLSLIAALITLIANGSRNLLLQATFGVLAAAGLSTAVIQARRKNTAQGLLTRLRQDTYTDLVIAAIAEIPNERPGRRVTQDPRE
jgi:hypothetical protein